MPIFCAFSAVYHCVMAVPHDQASRFTLPTWRRLRMNSTAASTSRIASSVVAKGGLAFGSCDICGGRVERP